MEHNSFDFPEMERAVNETYQQMAEAAKAKAEYQAQKDATTFETLDLLKKMRKESAKESQINTKRFIIQTAVSVAALIAAVVGAVATVISLM